MLSHFSHVRLFATPWTLAHQGSSVHGTLQARILEWVAMPSSRGSSQPRDGTQVANIVGRVFTSLPSQLPGKPKDTGVGSLSLLQGIFLTQELNCDLLHQRWILYHLNFQGSSNILSTSDYLCFHWLVACDYGYSSSICVFLAI